MCIPGNELLSQYKVMLHRCFQVTRATVNITVDIATFVYLKLIQVQNLKVDSGVPISMSWWCTNDTEVEYVCLQLRTPILTSKRFFIMGFSINIFDGSELFYSLTLAGKHENRFYKTHAQCLLDGQQSTQKQVIRMAEDMTEAHKLLNQSVCDLGTFQHGEVNQPQLQPTIVWYTLQCNLHTNPPTHHTKGGAPVLGFDPEVILSYGVSAVSITSLAPVLLYNARYVSTWPLPKRLLYNQIMTLFLSHLVTVVGMGANDNWTICKIIGALIHYLWLSMYCWTVICAWHMYVIFAVRMKRMRIVDEQTFKTLYLRYRVFGYGCPLLFVMPAAILDILQWQHIYGSWVCFIADYETLVFLFAIPIGFSCLFNVLAYATTTYNMFIITTRVSVIKYSFEFYVKLFVKMWFMLNFTSVSAFLAIIINNKTAWYVFICMYGLQSIVSSVLLGFHNNDSKSKLR